MKLALQHLASKGSLSEATVRAGPLQQMNRARLPQTFDSRAFASARRNQCLQVK